MELKFSRLLVCLEKKERNQTNKIIQLITYHTNSGINNHPCVMKRLLKTTKNVTLGLTNKQSPFMNALKVEPLLGSLLEYTTVQPPPPPSQKKSIFR